MLPMAFDIHNFTQDKTGYSNVAGQTNTEVA